MSAGPLLITGAIGAGTLWLARRRARATGVAQLPAGQLEPWERAAVELGDVGAHTEHDPTGVDEAPVGRGSPAEYCLKLGAGEDDDDSPLGCLVDPLADPRFAPIDRGAPLSSIPSHSTWPVVTRHSARLVVSYWTAGGPRGYSGRAFAAKRADPDGARKHAGVDLFAKEDDLVVAPEDGRVLTILPFNLGTWAVYIRSTLDDRVVNLGEVTKSSWREFDVKPGVTVKAGQPVARIGLQGKSSTMLHFETFAVAGVDDESVITAIRQGQLSWPADATAPAWLRDPSGYLLMAAQRTYQRESLGMG